MNNINPEALFSLRPFPVDNYGNSGENGGMEARIARLESDVAHIQSDVSEIKGDVKDLRKSLDSKFLWILSTMLGMYGAGFMALLALISKGFGWI